MTTTKIDGAETARRILSGESLIGSDPAHTKWCRAQAKYLVKDFRRSYPGASLLSAEVQEDMVMAMGAQRVLSQISESMPLWRMQELLRCIFTEWTGQEIGR